MSVKIKHLQNFKWMVIQLQRRFVLWNPSQIKHFRMVQLVKVQKLSQMPQELPSTYNMINKIIFGENNWLRIHFLTPNKLLDQMQKHPSERLFMMLLLMDVILCHWIENPMENMLKSTKKTLEKEILMKKFMELHQQTLMFFQCQEEEEKLHMLIMDQVKNLTLQQNYLKKMLINQKIFSHMPSKLEDKQKHQK